MMVSVQEESERNLTARKSMGHIDYFQMMWAKGLKKKN
jgi:hypothetical protein